MRDFFKHNDTLVQTFEMAQTMMASGWRVMVMSHVIPKLRWLSPMSTDRYPSSPLAWGDSSGIAGVPWWSLLQHWNDLAEVSLCRTFTKREATNTWAHTGPPDQKGGCVLPFQTPLPLLSAKIFRWKSGQMILPLWRLPQPSSRLWAHPYYTTRNCSVGEDSWESLGLQGDPTSQF